MNTILFGPPGTGKTAALLQHVESELAVVPPERIAYVSFTNAAVEEAASRAMLKFGYNRKQLRWFRTLHSVCFTALAVERGSMLTDYSKFASAVGAHLSTRDPEGRASAQGDGDQFLSAHALCIATGLPYEQIQQQHGFQLGSFRFQRLLTQLEIYKADHKLIEYHDLLLQFLASCEPLPIDVAFIDEAQDLTPLQWRVAHHAFKHAQRLYVAGDDDQAIYQWAGADPLQMITLQGERKILGLSHRLGQQHADLALAISARIKQRQVKSWQPADPRKRCSLHRWWKWNDLDWPSNQSWFVLARAGQFLPELAQQLKSRGLNYSFSGAPSVNKLDWAAFKHYKDLMAGKAISATAAAQLLAVSKNATAVHIEGKTITSSSPGMRNVDWLGTWPRHKLLYLERVLLRYGAVDVLPEHIALTTIHQAKGKEADNVVLCPDLPERATLTDAEHRVWYVGATRARHRLFLLQPCTHHFYRV